jgi:threonine synthase
VVTVTGHGLKDIETPLEHLGAEVRLDYVVDADVDQAAAASGLANG